MNSITSTSVYQRWSVPQSGKINHLSTQNTDKKKSLDSQRMIVLKSQNGFVTQDQRAQFERWGVDITPITSATVRLLGGTPEINDGITDLSQLVSLSKNYKLQGKLKTYFSELTPEAIRDGQIGQGLALPEACRAKLDEISALVHTELARSESNRGADAEQVPNQAAFITALQQTFRTAFLSVRATPFSERETPCLDAFLETDPILRWANETTLEFFNYLDREQDTTAFVRASLTDEAYAAVNEALEQTIGYDIASVLAEIVEESRQIVTVIDHIQQFRSNATFFDGKGVSIRDRQFRIIKEGVITSAEMGASAGASQKLTLKLTDATEISLTLINAGAAVSEAAYQTIEQRTLFHHLDMTDNQNTASTIYRIKTGVSLTHLRDCLPDGNYRIQVIDEVPSGLGSRFRSGFKRITFMPHPAPGFSEREFKYYHAETPVRLNLGQGHGDVTGPTVEMVLRSIDMKKVDNQRCPFAGDVFKRAIRVSPDVDESHMHIQTMKKQTEHREQLLSILTSAQNAPILRALSEIAMTTPDWESSPAIGVEISGLRDQSDLSWRTTIDALFSLEPAPPTPERRQAEIGFLLKEGFYRHFVRNALSEKVASLLGLIADTGTAINAMRGKTAIVYLGNTGSGKSTLVSHHLGFPIVFRPSIYGGPQAEINDTSGDPRPGVGHSIARSETLYASAYPIRPSERRHLTDVPNLNDVALVDFPGFSDTRGTDYEICTSLSTDQTIRTLGRNVKAYVIVMQYSDFDGRGTGLVKLMSDLNSRFPNMLDPDADITPFHIFINKVPDGIRSEQIEARISRGNSDISGTGGVAARAWNFLDRMHAHGKVTILNLRNRRERDRWLVDKLIGTAFNAAALRSVDYSGSFSNRNTDYANTMKEISDSWQDRVLAPYLDEKPREIAALDSSLAGDSERLAAVTVEQDALERELTRSETERGDCQSVLSGFAPGEVIDLDALNPIVAERVRTQLSAQLANLRAQLVTQRATATASRTRVATLTTEHRTAQTTLGVMNDRIAANRVEIPRLSTGVSQKTFVEWRPRAEDRYSGSREWLPGRREALLDSTEAAQPGRDYIDSDGNSGTWGTYRGKSAIQDHLIRSDYNILPTDPTLNDQLQRLLGDLKEVTLGEIQVKMDSRNTAVVGVKAPTGGGNLVRYQLEYTFDGNPANMPYCHIYHRIPNHEINRADIVRLQGQLESDNASRARVVADENTASANLRAEQQRLAGYVRSQSQTQQEIARQTGAAVRDALTNHITFLETRIRDIPAEIVNKAQEIESLSRHIVAKTDRLSTLRHERKLLGFVIRQRREELRQIVGMMEIMVGDGVSEEEAAANPIDRRISSIIESCRAFTRYYGEQEQRLDASLRAEG